MFIQSDLRHVHCTQKNDFRIEMEYHIKSVKLLCWKPTVHQFTVFFQQFLSLHWNFTGHSKVALPCWSSAASFFPLKHLQKNIPQHCLMNKEALPLFPWVLFPCCYTECVLLTKPVMVVRLPCLPVSLWQRRHQPALQHRTHTLMHSSNRHPPSSLRSCIQWSTNVCPDSDSQKTSASIW